MRGKTRHYSLETVAVCAAGLSLSLGACKNETAPGCRIAQVALLPATPLAQLANARLSRVMDGFFLAGVDGNKVRWAKIASDLSSLNGETALALPASMLAGHGPWFAPVGKSAAADQLVVAFLAQKTGVANQVEIQVVVQDVGTTSATAPQHLADLPTGADLTAFALAMAPSQVGRHAMIAWGFATDGSEVHIRTLAAHGQPAGPEVALSTKAPWDCLAFAPGRTDLILSLLESDLMPSWRSVEVKPNGMVGGSLRLVLNKQAHCPTVAPTAKGYALVWQNDDGTFLAEFNLEQPGTTIPFLVAGAVKFGGAKSQPPVACLAQVGKDFSITFARPSGPEVWRIDNVYGTRVGAPLVLPSRQGDVGPTSAWPASNASYTTYLDLVSGSPVAGGDAAGASPTDGNLAENQRYLIKVDCLAKVAN